MKLLLFNISGYEPFTGFTILAAASVIVVESSLLFIGMNIHRLSSWITTLNLYPRLAGLRFLFIIN